MKKAVLVLLSFLVLFSGLFASLLYTRAGVVLLQYGLRYVDGLSVKRIEGRLVDSLIFSEIAYTSDGLDVSVKSCQFSWEPGLLLESTLQFGDLLVKDVVLRFKETDQPVQESSETLSLPEISLPLAVFLKRLRIENIWFQEKNPDSWMIREIELAAEYDHQNYIVHTLYFDAPQAVFDLHGKISTEKEWPVDISGNWKLTFDGYSTMAGDIRAEGPVENLAVEANASRPFTLSVKGALQNLLNDPTWDALISNGYGNLQDIHPSWPDIELEHLAAEGQGTFGTYGGRVSGTASYWRAQGVSLIVDLLGNEDGISFQHIDGYLNGAHAIVNGEIGWLDRFFWKGKGVVEGVNPAQFVDHFEGAIDGVLTSEGEIGYEQEDILHCYFESSKLSGTLQGYPVHGQARVRVVGVDVGFEEIEIYSEDSLLKLNGRLTDDFDLDFSVQSPDIGHFITLGKGALEAEGRLEGPMMSPLLDFKLAGTNIAFETTRVAEVRGKGRIDLSTAGKIDASITASDMQIGQIQVEQAGISSKGHVADHCIDLNVNAEIGNTDTRLCGSYDQQRWKGNILKVDFSSDKYGVWRLDTPVEVLFGADKRMIDSLCMGSTDGDVCFDFSSDGGQWASSLNIDDFDLLYLQKLVSIPYNYQGKAKIGLKAAGNRGALYRADLTANIDEAEITIPFAEDHTKVVKWDKNVVTATINDKRIDVSINSRFADGSFIVGKLSGDGVDDGFEHNIFEKDIIGSIEVELAEVEDLSFLTGYMVRPKGKLQSHLDLSGSLVEPVVDGYLAVQDGEFFVPSIGVTFKNTTMDLEADREGVWINAVTHLGEGTATGEGYVLYELGKEILGRFAVTGNNLTLVDLPEYEITANPDILFLFNSKTGRVSGDVEIPKARIAPVHLATAVSESKDVVYVDGGEEGQNTAWPLKTDLQIRLGENVVVNSFGLHGHVVGNIHVEGEPGEDLTGLGELIVKDATFSIYRRILDIERGRVQFSGGPIENPSLDIRAQKSVEDNIAGRKGGWTVGVDVSGNIDDLDFELFSSPVMSDSDILAYFIVGHSADSSSSEEDGLLKTAATALGVGATAEFMEEFGSILPVDDVHMEGGSSTEDASIVVGKRLTEDLYLGYDYNFYQSTSEFILRYNLGKGFYIETQSSSDANGADIFYTFEN